MQLIVTSLVSFAGGAVLGLVFFRGLWLTLRRLNDTRHPAVWMLASLSLRFALVLGAFYVIARWWGLAQVLAALLGFTLMRMWILRRTRSAAHRKGSQA